MVPPPPPPPVTYSSKQGHSPTATEPAQPRKPKTQTLPSPHPPQHLFRQLPFRSTSFVRPALKLQMQYSSVPVEDAPAEPALAEHADTAAADNDQAVSQERSIERLNVLEHLVIECRALDRPWQSMQKIWQPRHQKLGRQTLRQTLPWLLRRMLRRTLHHRTCLNTAHQMMKQGPKKLSEISRHVLRIRRSFWFFERGGGGGHRDPLQILQLCSSSCQKDSADKLLKDVREVALPVIQSLVALRTSGCQSLRTWESHLGIDKICIMTTRSPSGSDCAA